MAEIAEKYKKSYVKFRLTNVKVYWAKVHQPDTKFEHKWSVDLHLDDDVAKNLRSIGLNVRKKTLKDGTVIDNYLKVGRKCKKKDGTDNKPPVVVGPDGRTPFTEDIGNGSVCNLNLSARAWKVNGEWKLACYLDGVQVVTHEIYEGGFDDVSGDSGDDVPF